EKRPRAGTGRRRHPPRDARPGAHPRRLVHRLGALAHGVGPRKIAAAAPDLLVEVLSPKNTRQEIQRKLREYFLAGTRLAWVLQPKKQTAEVYTSPEDARRVAKNGTLDGGAVLPGFKVSLKVLFAEANRPPKRR